MNGWHLGLCYICRLANQVDLHLRSSLSKAERRAEHNAVERARRESLNGKFQQLAESLPNLQNYRRPSKGQIVDKALDWIRQTVHKEHRYQYQLYQLQKENKRLLALLKNQQDQASPSLETSTSTASPQNIQQQQQQLFHAAQQHSTPPSMMEAPQLVTSFSSDSDSPNGSRIGEEGMYGEQASNDHRSMSTMVCAATLPRGMHFCNGWPIIPSSSSLSSSSSSSSVLSQFPTTTALDVPSWSKIDASSVTTLVPSLDLPYRSSLSLHIWLYLYMHIFDTYLQPLQYCHKLLLFPFFARLTTLIPFISIVACFSLIYPYPLTHLVKLDSFSYDPSLPSIKK